MESDVHAFIAHARSRGMDHATIRLLLLSEGWKERDIARALSSQALDLAVPPPPDAGTARDVFLHLTAAASLFTGVGHALTLVFSYINLLFPDAAASSALEPDVDRNLIPLAMAAVLVSFPLFVLVMRRILRELHAAPHRAQSSARRWVSYATLYLASGVLAGDLIALVAGALQGDLTVRFLLKCLSVFAVAGAAFSYYLKTLALEPSALSTSPLHRRFAIGAGVLLALVLVGGGFFIGSPAQERLRRLDAQRAADLKSVSEEIFGAVAGPSWRTAPTPLTAVAPLPGSLEEVRSGARQRRPRIFDPVTGETYGYERTGVSTFRLCATFARERDEEADPLWNHPAGRHCFSFDAASPRR